jgi:hypothetical protein
MARLLSELVINATLATLQAYLPAELVGITTERADSAPLPAVESWYGYAGRKPSPDHVEVEVYERGMSLPALALDLSTWLAGGRGRLTTRWSVLIGVNCANREIALANTMATRARRYGAAVARVLMNHPDFGQVSGLLTLEDFSMPIIRPIGEPTRGQWRVEIPFTAKQQETQAGEMTASGGIAPVAILEQV